MKKTKIILIALFLVTVMAFAVAGCNAGTQNDLQSAIDDLQSQVEEMENRIAEMEDQIGERDATIENLNEQIKKRDEKIEQLEEFAEKFTGKVYSLQEAYNNGWLTLGDIMSIAYYHNGGRSGNEEIMDEYYEPSPKTPEVLSSETELKIKSAAAKEYREKYNIENAEADGFTITEYYGTYSGCIAVRTDDIYSGYAAVVWTETVAGIKITYYSGYPIKIWRKTI